MSRSLTYPTSTWSISATPPPVAVELTFQMVRPASCRRTRSAASTRRRYRWPPTIGSSSETGRRGTSTTLTRLTALPSVRTWPDRRPRHRGHRHRVTVYPYDAPPAAGCDLRRDFRPYILGRPAAILSVTASRRRYRPWD